MEIEDSLVESPAKYVHSLLIPLDPPSILLSYCIFDRNRRASGSLSVRGVEISNTAPKHPVRELERRVNALEEAIKAEVCNANPVGCQALSSVLGARIPTILLHPGRSFGDIPGCFDGAHSRSHFFGYQGCLRGYQRICNRTRPKGFGRGRKAIT
jgi:hypothetical protein